MFSNNLEQPNKPSKKMLAGRFEGTGAWRGSRWSSDLGLEEKGRRGQAWSKTELSPRPCMAELENARLGHLLAVKNPNRVPVIGQSWQPHPGKAHHLGLRDLLLLDPLSRPLKGLQAKRKEVIVCSRSLLVTTRQLLLLFPSQEAKSNTNKTKALGVCVCCVEGLSHV